MRTKAVSIGRGLSEGRLFGSGIHGDQRHRAYHRLPVVGIHTAPPGCAPCQGEVVVPDVDWRQMALSLPAITERENPIVSLRAGGRCRIEGNTGISTIPALKLRAQREPRQILSWLGSKCREI